MTQEEILFAEVSLDKLQQLSKEELIKFFKLEQQFRIQLQKENARLIARREELKQRSLWVDDQLITLKNKLYGKSSEREPSQEDKRKQANRNQNKKKKIQLPSQRYPDAPLIEREVELKELPECSCCGTKMKDSGMTENSEHLTVIPAQYMVIRQKRHKYRCVKCYGDIVTAPAPPKIKPGSGYSDEMVIDVAMSKYCDLIPIERYSAMAGREGLKDLPPQSLIEQTHYLADFVEGAYERSKQELFSDEVTHADETPHGMLEDNDKKSWYLWGFSNEKSSYFEIKNSRSGNVASELLSQSKTRYLVSDVFSGYAKAVKQANKTRQEQGLPIIENSYCNAHARRKFKEAKLHFPDEAQPYMDVYKKIYRLDKIAKARPPDQPKRALRVRKLMKPLFEQMKAWAEADMKAYSSKSSIGKAMSYFLKNYQGLTLFIQHAKVPIDNNPQERQLRDPVIGRKTWYGNHSKRGARTTAILFSLVQSCKLNKINPREYFKHLVQDLHQGKDPYTPAAYAENAG